MFLTNPYMARRGISVPMDLAFPAKPAVSPGEEGGYRSSVCCRSPGYCRGWSCACAKPARPPPCPALPCPALPALLLEWLCLLPWGCSHSGEGPAPRSCLSLPCRGPSGAGGRAGLNQRCCLPAPVPRAACKWES